MHVVPLIDELLYNKRVLSLIIQDSHTRLIRYQIMFSAPHIFRTLILAALPLALVRADSCTASQPEHFCCEAFGHFSDNYYVWHGICGLDYPNSTTVGSFCDEETPW